MENKLNVDPDQKSVKQNKRSIGLEKQGATKGVKKLLATDFIKEVLYID